MDFDFGIPKNATIRSEHVGENGPYLYAYWKQDKKLKKKYIGKTWDDLVHRWAAKEAQLTPATYRKCEFIRKQAQEGNKLAQEFEHRLEKGDVQIEWVYRKLKDEIESLRIFRLYSLAKREGFELTHESHIEYIRTIMKRQGLDSIEALDSYLKTVFM